MTMMNTNDRIEDVVLEAIRNANMGRTPDKQLQATPDAPLFGPGSPLDSLGLVALLIDIEEAFADRGAAVSLSDERAMSQTHSPFRTVSTLVSYIQSILVVQA
jgi:acyl carrier protein